jgi:nucleoside-diphosphate-sugar epimerase
MTDSQNDCSVNKLHEFYDGKTVVVAGVTGFLGANCAIALRAAGAKVVGVARHLAPLGLSVCDVFVSADLGAEGTRIEALANAAVLFDCLAYTELTPTELKPAGSFDAAFRPTVNLLTRCAELPNPPVVVHVSSRLVYGAPLSLPVDENHPLRPGTLYAANKLLLENYLEVFSKTHGLKTIVFRLSSPYGPNAPTSPGHLGVWNQFISKAMRGESLSIYGEGNQRRDFIHVDDVMKAFLLASATEKCVGQTFNLGGERAIPLRDAVTIIAREAGGVPVKFVPWPAAARKVETGDYCSNLAKIREFIDLPPQTSFEDGVRATVEAIRRKSAEPADEQRVVPFAERSRRTRVARPRMFAGQKVMVVGASGFLGTHLVRRFLSHGASVCAVSRSIGALGWFLVSSEFSFQCCDLTSPEATEQALRAFRPDFVIYAAACPDGPETAELIRRRFNVNVVGLVNLLEACCQHAQQPKLLFGDSRKVYGNAVVPHKSSTHTAPLNSYAFTKDAGWRMCQLYAALHGLTPVSIRPSLIYGPGQGPNVIRNIWEAAKRGDATIPLLGGEQTRDPIYIDDAVDAFVAAAQKMQDLSNKTIVIGGYEEITINGLAKLVLEVSGSDAAIVAGPAALKETDMLRSVCDLSEAERLLGWSPRVSLREGLRLTFAVDIAERSIA